MKIIKLIPILLILLIPLKINAATANINIKNNNNTIVNGGTITTKITVSSSAKFSSIDFYLNYSDNLQVVSGDTHKVDNNSIGKNSVTYTYKFKATKEGNANISIGNKNIMDINGDVMSVKTNTSNIKITEKKEENYSKNNYLSYLEVQGYKLTPKFDKQKNEFIVKVNEDEESIHIKAKPQDKKASVEGVGKFELKETDNNFEILCTSESGLSRSYTIKVEFEDKNPINIKIDGKKYILVKSKNKLIELAPEDYSLSKLEIDGEKINVLKGDKTKLILVVLKDSDDNYALYYYDKKQDEYYKYFTVNFDKTNLFIMPEPFEPADTDKVKLKYDDEKINAFLINNKKKTYYVYAMNIDNGKINWYKYDKKNDKLEKVKDEDIKKSKKPIIYLCCAIALLGLITGLIILIKKTKK